MSFAPLSAKPARGRVSKPTSDRRPIPQLGAHTSTFELEQAADTFAIRAFDSEVPAASETGNHTDSHALGQPNQGGHQLPSELQSSLESASGFTLANVRIHDDAKSHALARAMSASSLTRGTSIYFESGKYQPSSIYGRALIAHEVAHSVQQMRPGGIGLRTQLSPGDENQRLYRKAHRNRGILRLWVKKLNRKELDLKYHKSLRESLAEQVMALDAHRARGGQDELGVDISPEARSQLESFLAEPTVAQEEAPPRPKQEVQPEPTPEPVAAPSIDQTPPAVAPKLPSGKGMFLTTLKEAATVTEMESRIQAANLSWLAIKRWHPGKGEGMFFNGKEMQGDYGEMLARLGVQIWIWGWAIPEQVDEFIKAMQDTVQSDAWKVKPSGIIVNAEADWLQSKRKNTSTEAKQLMDGLKSIGLPVGFCSYGNPKPQKLPWKEFSAADFGMPQIYDMKNNLDADYPEQSMQDWRDLGFEKVIPVNSTAQGGDKVRSLHERTPTPEDAIIWWSWANTQKSSWSEIEKYELDSEQ